MIQVDFIEICCHKQGTHTIQTIFDNMTMPQEEEFIKRSLEGKVFQLSKDNQGTHVIRKVLQCESFAIDMQNFIFEEIFDHFNELCSDRNGLCVIKIIVDKTRSTRDQQRVIQKMGKDLIQIVSNPYGNYAVSEIITNWNSDICVPIFNLIATKISELSI